MKIDRTSVYPGKNSMSILLTRLNLFTKYRNGVTALQQTIAITVLLFVSSLSFGQEINYQWAHRFGDASDQRATSSAVDASGNVYISGFFNGTVDFDPSASTANLSSVGENDIFLSKYDASGNYLWAIGIGGTSFDVSNSVAIDANGNAYICGDFTGNNVDFDPSGSTANLNSSGARDMFLAKYDASGSYLWSIGVGGTSFDYANSVALDSNGNAYITGQFLSTAIDFNPLEESGNLVSAGSGDIFLAKYDASGNYLWANRMGGADNDVSNAVSLDANGNVYISGTFLSTNADFDPTMQAGVLSSSGATDVFLAKYDAFGNYIWANSMGGSATDVSNSLAVDSNGNAYISGYFSGTNSDFDPSSSTAYLSSAGSGDIFLAKYSASGNYLWAKRIGGSSLEESKDVALDSQGNVFITGSFVSTSVDFDPSVETANLNTGSAGFFEIFMAKYDSDGNYLIANSMGGTYSDFSTALAIDTQNNVFMSGYFFSSNADFDPSEETEILDSAGNNDIFLAKYSTQEPIVETAHLMGLADWNADCGSRPISIELYQPGTSNLLSIYNTSLDSEGNFILEDLQTGTYDLLITVEGYLSQLYADVIIGSDSNTLEITGLSAGDFNNSNSINLTDISILCAAFGSSEEMTNFNLLADLNCDGLINIIDLSILNLSFGLTGD